MAGKYSFKAPREMFNNRRTITLIRNSDPSPRCGDCTQFVLNFDGPNKCKLKNKEVRIYNKCDFFKRNIWTPENSR